MSNPHYSQEPIRVKVDGGIIGNEDISIKDVDGLQEVLDLKASKNDLQELDQYTRMSFSTTNMAIRQKADQTELTDLQQSTSGMFDSISMVLSTKADTDDVYTKEQVDDKLAISPKVAPKFKNGWKNLYEDRFPAMFRRDQRGQVYLEGVITGGEHEAECFTLPEGYRPIASRFFPVAAKGAVDQLYVDSSGRVVVRRNETTADDWVSLDGISFFTD